MSRGKLLIVEDEVTIATCLQMFLETCDFDVSTASNSTEALEVFKKERPELVLMDISLPGDMNGISLSDEIWNNYHTPSIYVSGYQKNAFPGILEHPAARGYITKPYSLEQMEKTVDQELTAIRKH